MPLGTEDELAGRSAGWFLRARASFALDEPARNASAGIGKLAVLHGEREEVDALFRVGRSHGRAKDGVIAAGRKSGAGCLLGDPSRLKLDLLAAGKLYADFLFHWCVLFSFSLVVESLRLLQDHYGA
jgi:hypothetical protein